MAIAIEIVIVLSLSIGCSHVLADSGPAWLNTTLDNVSYTEQEGWVKIDADVTVFSNTDDFSEGYLEVNITDGTSYDEFRLVSSGLLTVSGDAVSWDGERVGTIHNTKDGSNGVLRIDFSSSAPLPNADFETGDLTGWTVNDTYPGVNGTVQAWVESPLDDPDVSTVDSDPRIDDHNSVSQSATVQSSTIYEGSYALKLTIGGNILEGYGTAHGPMITSSSFAAAEGDNLSLNWNAVAGGDWYDVYGFIFKDANDDGIWDNGENYQKLFHDVGSTTGGWITTNATVNSNVAGENVRFVFLNGNYDKTGGQGIGSDLYIDGIVLEINTSTAVNNSIMESVIENIEYNNTYDSPIPTKTYTLTLKESNAGTGFNTGYINITTVDPILTLGNIADLTIDWGIILNLNHSIAVSIDPANNAGINYNISWITDSTPGNMNTGEITWSNQTISNSTAQDITVLVNANTTTPLGNNDSAIFQLNITKRDINITSDPITSQNVNRNELFWINGSAQGEYSETFLGNATLTRNGVAIGTPKTVTDGNASFNWTESSGGTYNFAVLFYNSSYYFNTSTNNSVVTVPSPSSSSSSGSRAYVGPSQPPEEVMSTDSAIKHVIAGDTVDYDFGDAEGPVIGISFDAKDDKGVVVANVQVLEKMPDVVTGSPEGVVGPVMSITVGSEGTISQKSAENILIEFKVSWEWIKENNIDPTTIRLSRFHDGKWEDLPTTLMSDNGEILYFTAETPGFSIFSVVGDNMEEAADVEIPVAEEPVTPEEAEDSPDASGFTSFMAIGIVGFAFLMYRKVK
ncbi:PGF-pre-PGF domain-containing protein [Methanohalophilus levihalophilus]|uniref:PGF-pre-PGF domain-containing protein n=1 Tax=Methanohalophilus levihalophilus TaxID=1431282 RepID=UPI001AE86BF2|nr:PGF-pre-PGF domain-containing protein [Methanohalophilus levihalophilus]MBP2029483.1 PGF-pre-PGF domain-containing protein [Methanohalophilus levihalophilus]